MISYDSSKAITVTKKDDSEYWLRQYDLQTYEKTFEEMIGGKESDYIKLKDIC
jgi:hypothetical protein